MIGGFFECSGRGNGSQFHGLVFCCATACTTTECTANRKDDIKGIVIAKRTDDIQSLDPHESVSSSAAEIIGNLYETLVKWDPVKKDFVSGIAACWKSSADNLTWTFQLPYVRRFSSGNAITVDDVAFSPNRIFEVGDASSTILAPLGLTTNNIKKAVKPGKDNNEIVITLPAGAAWRLLLPCLSASVCSIVDSEVVLRNRGTDPILAAAARMRPDVVDLSVSVPPTKEEMSATGPDHGESWLRFNSAGSGPFVVTNGQRTDEIVLRPNPCHDKFCSATRPIIVRHVSDPREQRVLLARNKVQVARNLPDASMPTGLAYRDVPRQGEPLIEAKSPKANLLLLCMNLEGFRKPLPRDEGQPPKPGLLTSAEGRRAVRHAIDPIALATRLASARWSAQHGFCPSALRQSTVASPFDRKRSGDLLELARTALGFASDEKAELTIDYMAGNPRTQVVQVLGEQLGAVGIKLEPRPGTGRQFLSRLSTRSHQLALLSWNADYLDPHSNANAFCANDERNNRTDFSVTRTLAWYCRWYDPDLSKACNSAAAEPDETKRKRIYDEIEKKLLERSPFVFLLEETDIAYTHKNGPKISIGMIDSFTRYPVVNA